MKPTFRVEVLSGFTDERGLVFEPLRPSEFTHQQNAHVVLTQPGCIRGNHFHPRGTEICVIKGPALVRIREDSKILDFDVISGEVKRFLFPPGVAHAIQNTGEELLLLISFNTIAHDPASPDVVRDVLIPPTYLRAETN